MLSEYVHHYRQGVRKLSKKNGVRHSEKRRVRINGVDIFILTLICLTVVCAIFRSVILERIQTLSVKDTVMVTIKAERVDENTVSMIQNDSKLYENGEYFGVICSELQISESVEYALNEGELVKMNADGYADLSCNVKLDGVKTDDGFLLPSGRIVRENDTVNITGKGFAIEIKIVDIYAE